MLFLATCGQSGLMIVFRLLRSVVDLIKIFVPILLILFGTLDLAKAVIAGKEDEMKKFQGALIKRFIYGAAVFLIATFVMFITDFVADASNDGDDLQTNDWKACWTEAAKR